MSKDPKCWEGKDNTQNPRLYFCKGRTTQSCETIESVHSDDLGGYDCKSTTKRVFECNGLVQDFGFNLKGMVVMVIVPYYDACHIPGGCGPKACMPGFGTAIIDQVCE